MCGGTELIIIEQKHKGPTRTNAISQQTREWLSFEDLRLNLSVKESGCKTELASRKNYYFQTKLVQVSCVRLIYSMTDGWNLKTQQTNNGRLNFKQLRNNPQNPTQSYFRPIFDT